MDDVVELTDALGLVDEAVGVADGVFDDCSVVGGKLEVLGGKLMDDGINFDDGRVDSVSDEGGRCSADSETAGSC